MAGDIQHVVVTVCTLKRPKMLEKCLLSISAQKLPPNVKLSIVVVENDSNGPSLDLVQDLRKSVFNKLNISIFFRTEGTRGIPFARNKALDTCRALRPDWIAFIDDDETATPEWIANHIIAQRQYHADVLSGFVHTIFETEPPVWAIPRKQKNRHGKILKRAATGNVFMRYWIIDPDGLNLSFDNRLTHGHEDTEFFGRAHQLGAKIVYNKKAMVTEFVPASRLVFKRHIMRLIQFSSTTTAERILKRGWFYALARELFTFKHVLQIIRSLLELIAVPFVWPFNPIRAQRYFYKAIGRVAKVAGAFYGLTGRQIRFYDTIDGA